ncbi:MFS-type transporter SLC18B1-like [Dreissena polymorpha]|uniref:Major facilitator superfamily (MFS) profile domain-containing protein n=1 Tax=Dreissena polymorpha TaxID=45954 RepID=A0A9D4QWG5_DREPO|nr:MFS-type transporter SLC18B1-like [Dreissena polymorpha]KAH3844710.1 hypothetical protein DPMN_086971 [Dreissena polymorpha]
MIQGDHLDVQNVSPSPAAYARLYSSVDNEYAQNEYQNTTAETENYANEKTPLLGASFINELQNVDVIKTKSRDRSGSDTSSSTSSEGLSIWTLSREQKIIIATTSFVDLLMFLSISIMAPFFPEEALSKGVSDTLSGWIFGTSPFVQFLVSPFIGKLIPHTGVKFMFLAGMFLFSGCTVLFGALTYVPTDHGNGAFIALAFCLQVFKSVGTACASTASFTLLIHTFPDNVSTMFGIGEIFVGIGLVSGPAIGGVLFGLGGFILPFVSVGGLAMLSIPLVAYSVPSSASELHTLPEDATSKSLPRGLLCQTGAFLICLCVVSSTVMWAILDPTLEPFLRKFKLSPEVIGVLFLVMAATYAASSPLWGWLSDKVSDERPLLILGFLGACLGSLLIGPSPLLGIAEGSSGLWLVIVALVIMGVSASLSSVPTFDMLLTVAQDSGFEDTTSTYSMVAGVWMSVYSLGDFIGPSVGGVLLDTVGFELMTTFSAGLCLFMAFILSLNWMLDWQCCKRCRNGDDNEVL